MKSAKNKLLTKQLNSSEDNILVSSTDDMNVKGKENLKTTPLEQSSNSVNMVCYLNIFYLSEFKIKYF